MYTNLFWFPLPLWHHGNNICNPFHCHVNCLSFVHQLTCCLQFGHMSVNFVRCSALRCQHNQAICMCVHFCAFRSIVLVGILSLAFSKMQFEHSLRPLLSPSCNCIEQSFAFGCYLSLIIFQVHTLQRSTQILQQVFWKVIKRHRKFDWGQGMLEQSVRMYDADWKSKAHTRDGPLAPQAGEGRPYTKGSETHHHHGAALKTLELLSTQARDRMNSEGCTHLCHRRHAG